MTYNKQIIEIEQANNLLIVELRKLARGLLFSELTGADPTESSEARTVKHLKSVLERIST